MKGVKQLMSKDFIDIFSRDTVETLNSSTRDVKGTGSGGYVAVVLFERAEYSGALDLFHCVG